MNNGMREDIKRDGWFTKVTQKLEALEKWVRGHMSVPHDHYQNDGWIPVSDTWTYLSANSFTIPTDGTTTYQKGDFVRWKEAGVFKYGVIGSLTATIATLIANTDHVVTNVTITDVSYSRAANPYGWPEWFNYTMTPSGSGGGTLTSQVVEYARFMTKGTSIWHSISTNVTDKGTLAGNVRVNKAIACTGGGAYEALIIGAGALTHKGLGDNGNSSALFLFNITYRTAFFPWASFTNTDRIVINSIGEF